MDTDLEKQPVQLAVSHSNNISLHDGMVDRDESFAPTAPHVPVPSKLRALNNWIEGLAGLEARGITRVPPEARHDISPLRYAQIAFVWYSANISANNLTVGMLGPIVFHLGFVDSVMMAVWGCLVGSLFTAYMSTWGPRSGNRTMVSIWK